MGSPSVYESPSAWPPFNQFFYYLYRCVRIHTYGKLWDIGPRKDKRPKDCRILSHGSHSGGHFYWISWLCRLIDHNARVNGDLQFRQVGFSFTSKFTCPTFLIDWSRVISFSIFMRKVLDDTNQKSVMKRWELFHVTSYGYPSDKVYFMLSGAVFL